MADKITKWKTLVSLVKGTFIGFFGGATKGFSTVVFAPSAVFNKREGVMGYLEKILDEEEKAIATIKEEPALLSHTPTEKFTRSNILKKAELYSTFPGYLTGIAFFTHAIYNTILGGEDLLGMDLYVVLATTNSISVAYEIGLFKPITRLLDKYGPVEVNPFQIVREIRRKKEQERERVYFNAKKARNAP